MSFKRIIYFIILFFPFQVSLSQCYGIDISKFQGDEIIFLKKKKDTLSFIICKATEGDTYVDPYFYFNWKKIKKLGFIRGLYHFYYVKDDPVKQANHFCSVANIASNDLPPIIDFENRSINSNISHSKIQQDLLRFLQIVENKTKRKPVIYTNIFIGNKYLNNEIFSNYPLWIADYNNTIKPNVPSTWKSESWVFWQKRDTYTILNKKNDFDVFHGNLDQLETFIINSHF